MIFKIETITDFASLSTLEVEWEVLDAELQIRTPFTSPRWNKLWWQHFQRDSMKVLDRLRTFVLRNEAGALIAVAPMMLTYRPGRLPIRLRELQFLGADQNMTEIRGMVCREHDHEAALAALAAHFTTIEREWDWIQWCGLPAPAPETVLPGFRKTRELQDFFIPLPETWDALRARLPRNIKESLRKCQNSLARDKVDWSLDIITEPEAVVTGLLRLLELHGMRADSQDMIAHLNVFARQEARAMIVDYVGQEAARGGACLFAMRIGDTYVAMRLGFLYERELYLHYSGYDPEWSRYSVMTSVVAGAIKWAIEKGMTRVNLSTGSDVSKTRWRPESVTFVEGHQVPHTWRSRLAYRAGELMLGRKKPVAATAAEPPIAGSDAPGGPPKTSAI